MENNKKPIILFVINPISGDVDKSDFEEQIHKHRLTEIYTVEIFYTTGENDLKKLTEIINEKSPEVCVAVGGDGTINLVASAIIDKKIKLGIIPGGSANGMAYELGIPSEINKSLDLLPKPKTKRIDAIQINDSHICLHLSDLGMNARIVKRFEEDNTRGLWGYAKQFFRELDISKKFKYEITSGNNQTNSKALMLVIANASYFGTGVNINPLGKLDDGKLDVIAIKPYPYWYILKFIVASIMGRLHQEEYVNHICTDEVNIKISPPQDLQVDGEIIPKQRYINAKILNHALEVIAPEATN